MANQTTEQQKQLDAMLFAGQKISAIKLYREWTNVGLKEAKDAVEAREAMLRQQSPESFAKKSGCASMILLAAGLVGALAWAARS
jgi:ribosomal protein L7/L12